MTKEWKINLLSETNVHPAQKPDKKKKREKKKVNHDPWSIPV